ncbi:hypothetical protein [Halanaerobium congolense]|uniref:DUF4359 domain-containing protein n=1 Tax=Halanaerobium congolense TaxID=54121 RepID=A0A1M7IXN4_9FIRM|nr:hypothetical protein [Halanaerobium congolense]KXS49625.1 MAG: hypothetical protein AWL62_897 [Halanaerobium sp. T82-1]OEG62526.1 MAG: hypothetical protein BHK79_06625 [Halanaerobium sp. MDAL1]PTX15469.1 hypothetical protein C7953_0106 [Halanaerobium congolense]SDF04794.1 hypothetical protein SAMN04488598_10595 [Halanaerobium congolense]SDG91069.1 hypothetical protein SAMN04515651_102123 [Halanaerobium congolense]
MQKLLITVIIILIILISAAITNPTREEFINWGVAEIKSEAETDIERIFGGAVAAPMLELQTKADDFVFFTIFVLEKSDGEVKYLGIFNNFFALN